MLDNHGKVAAAVIAFYVPTLVITGFLTFRHGFRKDLGWLYLSLFSIARIIYGILEIVLDERKRPSVGLIIAISILASVGLTFLLLATMGFLKTVSNIGFGDKPLLLKLLDRTQLLFTVAIVLSIAGGTMRSPTAKPSKQSTGRALVRAAVIILTATFALLVGYTVYFWTYRSRLTKSRLTLLRAFSLSIPFLIVRIIYSLLSAFGSTIFSKWSPVSGSWVAFLIMGLIMEYIVVMIYVTAGVLIPYSKDHEVAQEPIRV
ncbi:MAG: hypothetical protein M1813_002951 [Trichoglossum hirsutum]|nr:MAG: hypothetical protein M1813_002951 [Trichoglossum hirsutum]